MSTFTLPGDLDLAEFETPFETPRQLAEFILNAENESDGFRVLRAYFIDFAYLRKPPFAEWHLIYLELRLYDELPHVSLAAHGLDPVFRAAADLLNGNDDTRH